MPPSTDIRLTLDKPRTLRITWRSLEALEEQHGLSLDDISKQFRSGSQMKAVRFVVWLGLLHEDPGLTLDGVGDLLDKGNVTEIADAAARLITQRFSGSEGNGQAAVPKRTKKGPAAKRKR
jgi:hypothetical protein